MGWSQSQMVAVKVEVGPTIMLHSGARFDFCAPSSSNFTIEDIAHGLGNLCRYAGQCRDFYSVAEHSILVSDTAVGFEFEALLHDAAEAFLGDITRPLKQMLPDYRKIEKNVQQVVFDRFGLPRNINPSIKQADLRVLAAEQSQIMPEGTDAWAREGNVEPAPVVVLHLSPTDAKKAFLERFKVLRSEYMRDGSQGRASAFGE
jgi:hypothetical protein